MSKLITYSITSQSFERMLKKIYATDKTVMYIPKYDILGIGRIYIPISNNTTGYGMLTYNKNGEIQLTIVDEKDIVYIGEL